MIAAIIPSLLAAPAFAQQASSASGEATVAVPLRARASEAKPAVGRVDRHASALHPEIPAFLGEGGQGGEGQTLRPDVPKGMFEKGSLGVEFGGALLVEAWNLNDRQEWLADGSAAVFWAFSRRATLLVEFHASRISQVSSRNAFLNGLVPLVRFRLFDIPGGTLYAEGGPGISWSDTVTPPRGTQFNYLLQGTVGLARRLGSRSHLITGFRLLHVSNAGREGRARNPDIEALGAYAGLSLAF
jgi:hypothetical protein